MRHELWQEKDGSLTFIPIFNAASRACLSDGSELIWTCEANNYFAALTAYYEFMDWGQYHSELKELYSMPYSEEDKDWDLILSDNGLNNDLTEQQADDLALEAQRAVRANRKK